MSSINERDAGAAGAAGAIVSEEDASIIARGLEVLRKRELLAIKEATEVFYVVLEVLQEYYDAIDRYNGVLRAMKSTKSEIANRFQAIDIGEMMANADLGALEELVRDATEAEELAEAATRAASVIYCASLATILERMSEAAVKLSSYEVRVVSPGLCDKLGYFQRGANQWLTAIQATLDNEKQELEESNPS